MSAILRAVLIGWLAAICGMTAVAPAFGKMRPQEAAEEAAKRRPMAFFLAKGAPNACGEGCREWIAAEGVFDAGSGERLKAFLAELKRNDLPLFFNSPGGSVSQSIAVGTLLRARRMTVGIGRTRPDACEPGMSEDACFAVMKSGSEHQARLIVARARCYSACTYAFLGGSNRTVGRGALIGVHSAFPRAGVPDEVRGRSVVDSAHATLRRYALAMGVDSGLVDLAARTRPERMHRLTAEEIAHFGIETQDFYETGWVPVRQTPERYVLQKSVTQRTSSSPAEHLTSLVQIGCAAGARPARPTSYVAYRRELPLGRPNLQTSVRATFGEYALPFSRRVIRNAVETGYATARPAVLEQAAAIPNIAVVEIELSANGAPTDSRELKLSTQGLNEPLAELRKRCHLSKLTRVGASAGLVELPR
ncbi:MAG TPA: hypothetical protein VNR11_20585 [Xanthobacteraceae bacterium]|nr:hypothetical protein [Xanthobacteraceae bacterium]